jgi:hypothetical protein
VQSPRTTRTLGPNTDGLRTDSVRPSPWYHSIWPLPPAVFTYRRQRPNVVDGAASRINLVFHHTLLVAHRLLGPIHPQQLIKKVSQVLSNIYRPILLTFHGLTGLKTDQTTCYCHHTPFPSFEGCEVCRT